MAKIDAIDVPKLTFPEAAAPSTPASGKVVIYSKSDGLMYSKDDAGVETGMSNSAAAFVSGELDYVQITSPVNVTATAEASANTIITGSAVAYNGSTIVMVECFFPYLTLVNQSDFQLWLYDGSSSIGTLALRSAVTATGISGNQRQGGIFARRLTPSAATHTYSIRGTTSTGTAVAGAGAGGSGNHAPAYIRIYRP